MKTDRPLILLLNRDKTTFCTVMFNVLLNNISLRITVHSFFTMTLSTYQPHGASRPFTTQKGCGVLGSDCQFALPTLLIH